MLSHSSSEFDEANDYQERAIPYFILTSLNVEMNANKTNMLS